MRDEIGQFAKTGWRRQTAVGCVVVLLAFFTLTDRLPAAASFQSPAPDSSRIETEETKRPILGTPKVISESPFRIAAQINRGSEEDGPEYDFSALWDRLGFSPEDKDSLDERLPFIREDIHPKAEVENRDLDGKPGLETVLSVTNTRPDGTRLLMIFRQSEGAWHFLGALDSFFRWNPPEWRAKTFSGRTFFIIAELACFGSAYSCKYESWFEIDGDCIHPTFSFQAYGYQGKINSALDQETTPLTAGPNRLRLNVTYFLPDRIHAEGKNRVPLRLSRDFFFNWNEQRHRFEFDAVASGLTEAEFNAACDTSEQAWQRKVFFDCFGKQLRAVATQGNADSKNDLRLFLNEWGDASTNAPLLELLDRRP